jgi:hypothetical protein
MLFEPPDDGQRLSETYVGKSYILPLKFDSEDAFRWLIFSEFKMHGEGHVKCTDKHICLVTLEMHCNVHLGLYTKCPLLLSDFNQNFDGTEYNVQNSHLSLSL